MRPLLEWWRLWPPPYQWLSTTSQNKPGSPLRMGCRMNLFANLNVQAREVYMERMIESFVAPRVMGLETMKKADPIRISPWPASQKFGGILWANSAHGVSSAGCAGDGMEEVIGSIPIRSTKQPLYF